MNITTLFTQTEVEIAFKKLDSLLKKTKLPCGGAERYAKPEEFMFMYEENGMLCFKHCISRNYIAIIDDSLQLGDGVSPFQLYDFPPNLED